MKKNVLKIRLLASVLAAALMLTACSTSSGSKSDRDDDDDDEVVEETEEEETEPTETPTPTPEPTDTPTPTPEPETWFDSQGLSITPQGDFTYTTEWIMWSDDYSIGSREPGTSFEMPANFTITETTDGVADGYKKLIGTYTDDWASFFYSYTPIVSYDTSLGSVKPSTWISAFDRYTGVSFEPGDVTIPIEYEGKTYDVMCQFDFDYDYDYDEGHLVDIFTCTVICPVDYDGTVFHIGCGRTYSAELGANDDEPYESIDYSSPLMLDEFPFYGSEFPHVYFSLSNE
ncbi:MAG: hypothetical protein IKN80_02750 [Clostridiales bacterium]|nr:hypothetical protein [Clostridiales bacterium]